MLPRPGFLALVTREAVEADGDRTLRARRAEPGVDLVERARRGGHRQRGNHSLRQPVVIERRPQGARPVAFGRVLAAEQEHKVEVRGVGQGRPAQPAQSEHREPACGHLAVLCFELGLRGGHKHRDCRLGHARERRGDLERIALAFDQLDPQREAQFAIAFDAANNTAILSRAQYRSGLTDFITLNTAETSLLSARNGLSQARADEATALIQLYLALGGGWNVAGGTPLAPAPRPFQPDTATQPAPPQEK